MNKEINSWSEYWKMYDMLCIDILKENVELAKQLQEIKKYVYGLTDSWFEFLTSFKDIIEKESCNLSIINKQQADVLISILENSLNNRI